MSSLPHAQGGIPEPAAIPDIWANQEIHPDVSPDEPNDDSVLGNDDLSSLTASLSSSILRYRTVNGRTYHSDRGNGSYYASNDEQQSELLDILHHVLNLAIGGKSHLAPLPDDIKKVIDVGTGTGIWAIEFADEHPNAQITGFDLSPIQPTWTPPNVKFLVDDLTSDWLYGDDNDYVYMRWLSGCVPDWMELGKKAYHSLKPGGWVESYDCDVRYTSDDGTVSDNTALYQYGLVFREGFKIMGLKMSLTVVQDGLQRKALEQAGFINIQERTIKIPGSEWSNDPSMKELGLFSRFAVRDVEGLIGLSATRMGWTKEQITVFSTNLRKELRDLSIHSYFIGNVVYGQKPTTA